MESKSPDDQKSSNAHIMTYALQIVLVANLFLKKMEGISLFCGATGALVLDLQ